MPVKVKRLSDGAVHSLDGVTSVKSLKETLKKDFKPAVPNGCRLKYGGKVMKSRHSLKHYAYKDGETIEMDDTKNWSSSSSSSDSRD